MVSPVEENRRIPKYTEYTRFGRTSLFSGVSIERTSSNSRGPPEMVVAIERIRIGTKQRDLIGLASRKSQEYRRMPRNTQEKQELEEPTITGRARCLNIKRDEECHARKMYA